MISVAVVEDHPDLRRGLSMLLENEPGLAFVGGFGACEPLINQISAGSIEPAVILMDIGLPGMSGIEGVKQITNIHPDAQILMLTVFEDDMHVFQAICAGASGYLLKHASHEEILSAIEQAIAGGFPMTQSIARRVIAMFRDFAPVPSAKEVHITPREREVLAALVDGLDYKQVAARLEISMDTVRNHIRNIYRKLQVHSKSEAVARALKERLL